MAFVSARPLEPNQAVTPIQWHGIRMQVVWQDAEHGIDAKGRPWISNGGWYFTCEDCGNSGLKHLRASNAFASAVEHAESHRSGF
jgi:hypothetical protein